MNPECTSLIFSSGYMIFLRLLNLKFGGQAFEKQRNYENSKNNTWTLLRLTPLKKNQEPVEPGT